VEESFRQSVFFDRFMGHDKAFLDGIRGYSTLVPSILLIKFLPRCRHASNQ
jgi:hypothetical protein